MNRKKKRKIKAEWRAVCERPAVNYEAFILDHDRLLSWALGIPHETARIRPEYRFLAAFERQAIERGQVFTSAPTPDPAHSEAKRYIQELYSRYQELKKQAAQQKPRIIWEPINISTIATSED